MKKTLLSALVAFGSLLCATGWGGPAGRETVQLHMPDGQLRSHLIRVYVNEDITEAMAPELSLYVAHSLADGQAGETRINQLYRLSRDHRWTQKSEGTVEVKRGTLLLFDLRTFPIPWYKAMTRITPTVVWNSGEQKHSVVGEGEVYLANTNAAVVWSALVVAVIGISIGWLSWQVATVGDRPWGARVLAALCNPNGSLSIARVQLAAWTTAVGAVVFGFALIRLEVPEIPETLVALMGLSLATGGLGALKQVGGSGASSGRLAEGDEPAPDRAESAAPSATASARKRPAKLPMRLSDLVTYFERSTQQREVSVAKSQMVFWTVLTLMIFITKSLTDGTLWPVPWQLVVLMGMSQAGYVTPKLLPTTMQQ